MSCGACQNLYSIAIWQKTFRLIRRIARELNCSPNTVRNELERGKVLLYNGRKTGYRATIGQDTYDAARKTAAGIIVL